MQRLDGRMDAGSAPTVATPYEATRRSECVMLPPAASIERRARPRARRQRSAVPLGPWLLPISDFTAALAAALLALAWYRPGWEGTPPLLALPVVTVALLVARGAYSGRGRVLLFEETSPALAAVTFAAMLAISAEHLMHPAGPETAAALVAWGFALVLMTLGRAAVAAFEYFARVYGGVAAPTLIIGAGTVGVRVARRLLSHRHYGLRPIGFLDDDPPRGDPALDRPLPVLGGLADVAQVIDTTRIKQVVISFSATPDRNLAPLMATCARHQVSVSVVPRLFDCVNHRAAYEPLGGLPVLRLRMTDPDGWRFAAKHALDRVVAGIAIVLLAPLGAVIALAVKLSSPGPVLFSQVRVGRDGQVFRMLKFRTMRIGPPSTQFMTRPDCAPGGVEGLDRRTAVGRFLRRTSLDELPQLVNVLQGEMSMVGPRPERPEYVDQFTTTLPRYGERHRVRSGLTGLSQVRGLRGQSSISDRVELDNFYIEHWSFGLDLKVMLLTLIALVRSGG